VLLLLLLMMMVMLSYDQPVGPARPVRSGNIVVTLNFSSMIFTGKQEGIRWPSPRGVSTAKRSGVITALLRRLKTIRFKFSVLSVFTFVSELRRTGR